MYIEKLWKSCYESYRKIAEKGPKDTDNDATPDLYVTDELKPKEKKDIAKIQKSIVNRNLTRKIPQRVSAKMYKSYALRKSYNLAKICQKEKYYSVWDTNNRPLWLYGIKSLNLNCISLFIFFFTRRFGVL